MANENNNINELVSEDDDPTAELEVSALKLDLAAEFYREQDANTYDAADELRSGRDRRAPAAELETDLRARDKAISRLQFDIEQLRAKWLGLDSEVAARAGQTEQLNNELVAVQNTLARKEKLIKKRDRNIKSLKLEIRQRDTEHRALMIEFADLKQKLELSAVEPLATDDELATETVPVDLQDRLQRSEDYADTIRRQLQDMIESSSTTDNERDYLAHKLHELTHANDALSSKLRESNVSAETLQTQLDALENKHQNDIRILRFELGEAQDTMAETKDINSQLASDLIDARGKKDDLQQTLSETEDEAKSQILDLEKELKNINRDADALKQKLSTKSEAISVLLTELAKRPDPIEPAAEVEDAVQDFDNKKRNNAERMTRVLVGSIDGQVLRFPLFKEKLTIGRTEDNDIQLKATHISRQHAVLQTEGDTTRIIDWDSKNGVYVNAERVTEHFLNHGDILTIGNARFRYEERKKRDT